MTHDPTDHDLLRRHLSSDPAAFAQLVDRYVNLVYSTALRRTRNPHLAEDVTQTVFFLLLRKAGRLPRCVILAGWLYQTARYVSKDAMKHESRLRRRERAAAAALPRPEPTPAADWDRLSPELESALDRLPAADRDALLLRYFQGHDVAATAAALGLTPAAAAKRLQRALDKLRQILAGRGVHTPADVLGVAIATHALRPAPASLAHAVAAHPTAAVASKGAAALAPVSKAVIAATLALTAATAVIVVTRTTPTAPTSQTTPSPAPVAAHPTTLSAAQLQLVRANLFRLRHYQIGTLDNEWIASMKALVDAGPAAVPEIVAELDRTTDDRSLRALAFTLRAIRDPRACPALIRAIPRTSVLSSDYGLSITDPGLDAFMRQHQIGPKDSRVVIFGRSIREIAAALETITNHRIGRPAFLDARDDSPAQAQAAQARHESLARQWSDWWQANAHHFATDADLAALTAEPHDPTAIEQAGAAVFSATFPNPDRYKLSAIHDAILAVWDDNLDTPCLIDFDRAQVFSPLQSTRWFKPGVRDNPVGPSGWYSPDGAGAEAYATDSIIPSAATTRPAHAAGNPLHALGQAMLVTPADRRIPSLQGIDVQAWPVDNTLWDQLNTIPDARLDPHFVLFRRPQSTFEVRAPLTRNPTPDRFPATFAFRTREGGAGIVQLVEPLQNPPRLHLRYRTFEPHPGHFIPRPPCTLPTNVTFSPTQSVTLSRPNPASHCAINLDTCQTLSSPNAPPAPGTDPTAWLRPTGADAMITTNPDGHAYGLLLKDVTFAPLSPNAFNTLSAGQLSVALDHLSARPESILFPPGHTTALFKTHEGAAGLIQIQSVAPDAVTFRYKLLTPAN